MCMDCFFICVAREVKLRRQLMSKRIDYRFRALIPVGSADEALVKYLRSKDLEVSEKNMVLWAAAAYWLPLAFQKSGCYSAGQLKQSARTAIYKLRQHIIFLAQTFGLENELEVTMTGAISPVAELETTSPRAISPQTEQIEDELANNVAIELQGVMTSGGHSLIPKEQLVTRMSYPQKAVTTCQDFPSELVEENESYQLTAQPETTRLLHHNDDKMFEAIFHQ